MSEWLKPLVPGARVRIIETPSGLFSEGEVLEVVKVEPEDDWLHYRLVGGELANIFDEGQCSLGAFGDGSLRWEVV